MDWAARCFYSAVISYNLYEPYTHLNPKRRDFRTVIKPVLQALVLADNVYQDKSTGKMIIAGTFNQLLIVKPPENIAQKQNGPETPHEGPRKLSMHEIRRSGSPYAYISLTGVHGSVPLELRYTDLMDNKVIFVVQFTVACDDPLKSIEANFPVPPLPTPHPGVYALELLCNNELVGSHRITAIEAPASEAKM